MKSFIVVLVWCILPVLTHLGFDLYMQKHYKIRHWLSATIVVALDSFLGWLYQDQTHTWWMFLTYALSIHFVLFNPTWNLFHKESIWYTGDPLNPNRSLFDRMYDYIPTYARPLLWAWVYGVGFGVYYRMDLIIGYHFINQSF